MPHFWLSNTIVEFIIPKTDTVVKFQHGCFCPDEGACVQCDRGHHKRQEGEESKVMSLFKLISSPPTESESWLLQNTVQVVHCLVILCYCNAVAKYSQMQPSGMAVLVLYVLLWTLIYQTPTKH